MRARVIIISWVLAAQILAPSLALASSARAGCCCSAGSETKCHCPACAKARALEEGHALVGSCGQDQGVALPGSPLVAAVAGSQGPAAPELAPARLPPPIAAAPPSPLGEVPTPPPLV